MQSVFSREWVGSEWRDMHEMHRRKWMERWNHNMCRVQEWSRKGTMHDMHINGREMHEMHSRVQSGFGTRNVHSM